MRQRLVHELREAWHQLLHWQMPSVDQLRSQAYSDRPPTTTLHLTACLNHPQQHTGGGGLSDPQQHTGGGGLSDRQQHTGGGGGGLHRRSASASAVASASSKLGTLSSDVSRLCERLMSRFVKRVTRDVSTRVHVTDTQHSRTASITSTPTTIHRSSTLSTLSLIHI